MNLSWLATKNIAGSPFRSWAVALSALLIASFSLSTTLIMRGAESSLNLALERLGADIIVVPEGTEASVETALLMGIPTRTWMPSSKLEQVSAVPGIAKVSPQVYLSSLENASCCSASNMFLVAYDPTTDFTVTPWLESHLGCDLNLGEAVGGSLVFVPEGEENIRLYGYMVTLKANMEGTGTGLDQTMFLTMETARDIARISVTRAEEPLEIPENSISAIMVKVEPGSNLHEVAANVLQTVDGVTAIESPILFQAYRRQMSTLLRAITLVMGFTWIVSVGMIALIFSMSANERRRELGVLRALGAKRWAVLRVLLAEAGLLALFGGLVGVSLSGLAVYLFRWWIIRGIGFPFLFPSLMQLFLQVTAGLVFALLTVLLAAFIPAFRTSRQDPAIAMRE